MFAALYSEEVVGMVLVDSSHPDQWAYAPADFRSRAQPSAPTGLDGRPLVVVSASDHGDQGLPPLTVAQFERDWLRLQAELATLSNNSQHLVVEGSRHGTLQTTFAGVTSDAIRRVLDAARTHRPLAARADIPKER